MSKQKSAFTLVEILITLTIIGILAVVLIPRTVGNTSSEAARVKLRNTYNQLQNGMEFARNNDRVNFVEIAKLEHSSDSDNESTNIDDFVSKYFNGTAITRDDDLNGGLSVNSTVADNFEAIARTYRLPNGAHLMISQNTVNVAKDYGCTGPVATGNDARLCVIYIDINGAKGPNISMGTILKRSGDGFTGADVTGACLSTTGSEYKVVRDINGYCDIPVDVNYDIFPFLIWGDNIRPYSNAVLAALNGVKSSGGSNKIMDMLEQAEVENYSGVADE